MTEAMDALRKAMKAAQPTGRGSYLEEGRHDLRVENALCKRTEIDGKFKETYIVEFKVEASSNPTHEVDSTRTYAESPDNTGWLGRFKSCLIALAGLEPTGKLSPEDEEMIGDMIVALRYDDFRKSKNWPENFLKGRKVRCEGSPGKSRAGGPVTNKKWAPLAA